MEPFVSTDWLAQHRDEVVLADARMYLDGRSAEHAYREGHLPGATFVDVGAVLAGPASPEAGRHPLPTPEDFAAAMSSAGIGDHSTVVAYDDAGGVMAARLVWMLRTTGHRAAVLDGGMAAVLTELETGPPIVEAAEFTPVPWPADALASIDDAVSAPLVIDARDRTRFAGHTPDPIDPRSGHIPGARNIPCREHLEESGVLQPVSELRQHFAEAGVTDASQMISYCGSGVTACHNLLVAEHAGLGRGRLYPGSWSQYSNTDRPVETSPQP